MKKAILIALFPTLLLGCKQDHQQLAEVQLDQTAVPVRVQSLEKTNQALPLRAVGLLNSQQTTRHSFKIGGVIARVLVDEGDNFRAGQVLAELELGEISAQVQKAREGVGKLERDEERVASLYADTVATLEQFQDLQTALEVAKADLEIAEFNQRYARIVARKPGKVLQRFAEAGELIGPGAPVFLSSTRGQGQFVLEVGLVDRDVVKIALGDTAQVAFDAYPGEVFSARISEIAPQASPQTGLFEAQLEVDSRGKALRNGFLGKAHIFPGSNQNYFRIPLDAVVEANGREVQIFLADTVNDLAQLKTLSFVEVTGSHLLALTREVGEEWPVVVAGTQNLIDQSPIVRQ